jgi:hypothetical protein
MILIFRPFRVIGSSIFYTGLFGYAADFAFHKDSMPAFAPFAVIVLTAAFIGLRMTWRTLIVMREAFIGR